MTGLPNTVPHKVTGGRHVNVTEPLRLGMGGRETAVAVQFLRECQALALDTRWETSNEEIPYDISMLHHLPPPAEFPGKVNDLSDWRAGHAYGMFYHRRGPDFVTVMDRRERFAAARVTLDHPDLLSAFLRLLEATPLDELSPTHREAVDLMAAERLILVTDGWAVTLPPRIQRWPIPCTRI